eukprot:8227255-Pyramimonas_sp.AAC.1
MGRAIGPGAGGCSHAHRAMVEGMQAFAGSMAGTPGGVRSADGRAHCCEGRMRVRQAGRCFAGVQCSEGAGPRFQHRLQGHQDGTASLDWGRGGRRLREVAEVQGACALRSSSSWRATSWTRPVRPEACRRLRRTGLVAGSAGGLGEEKKGLLGAS